MPNKILPENTSFWNAIPYSLIDIYWCLEGMCYLRLQGQNVTQASRALLANRLKFRPWIWSYYIPPKRR
jgi:hypothetical protein